MLLAEAAQDAEVKLVGRGGQSKPRLGKTYFFASKKEAENYTQRNRHETTFPSVTGGNQPKI
jgi:hypothetical protein